MITTETSYKLAEIIHNTWPQLYRPPAKQVKKPIDKKCKEV
jgi:hypothetical protein